MRIDNYSGSNMYQQMDSQNSVGQMSYKQLSTINRESDITITTAEGDVVKLSQDIFSGSEINFSKELSELGSMQTFTATSLQSENMSFNIEGDLNKEELSDVKHLFKDLFHIARDFFKGDLKDALKGSLKLSKHMGSISEVNASFAQTKTTSLSRSYHYLPELNAEFAEGFMAMEENEKTEDIISKILQSQWQQITKMLGLEKKDDPETSIPDPTHEPILASNLIQQPIIDGDEDENSEAESTTSQPSTHDHKKSRKLNRHFQKHAEKMMDRIADTFEKHPRLSPFAVPLADNAVELASRKGQDNSTGHNYLHNLLRNEFMHEYNHWLVG